jgi:hypothetical protein
MYEISETTLEWIRLLNHPFKHCANNCLCKGGIPFVEEYMDGA